ncbi:hypothetical protein, partial [Sandarakinorhabdus limnophila]|uniref:hypothetical protein n=1 Tax=Sandarakinorhabdus limnophila TaxID=210512 RepID=UPI0026F127AA
GVGGMPPTPLPSHQPSAIKAKDSTSERYQSGVHVRSQLRLTKQKNPFINNILVNVEEIKRE